MATTPPKIVPKVTPDDTHAQPKSKKKLYVMIGVVALVLSAGGAGAWLMLGSKSGHSETKKEPVKPPVFIVLDVFTSNLQPEAGEQFLQVNMTLQVADLSDLETIKTYMPLTRSRILLLLSSKKASDILSAEGKMKLATEVAHAVNQPFSKGLPATKVDNVLFTSFVVQ